MVRLFGKGVCTGAFSFDTWESLFRSLGVEIISKCFFFLLYCIIPSVKKLYTQFNFEVLSLNTDGIGGHSDSNKRRKLFNYLKKKTWFSKSNCVFSRNAQY